MVSYLTPYSSISVAEYLRDNGYSTVTCFDDFSKHAKVYRQIALISGRIPSRDA